MTEDQLRAIPTFAQLPVYDESDDRSESLTKGGRAGRSVRECSTLDEVMRCLKDSSLVPLGGLRAWVNGGPVVVAYFAKKE